ncbi:hypothetical protein MLD38_005891 [Melastoma candidum]|uniref:Uncharacterized protein n=1 Tax=Melastoma candidum TaxID=119954 RepID=A0ACB9RN26_9MYRT|nr:hypothetical protein MLD38_005891 [Melastoma candidum]
MMHMTFYWSKEVTLLFSTWKTTTSLSYSLSLLACFLSSFLYQLLDSLRLRLSLLLASPSSPDDDGDHQSLIPRFSRKVSPKFLPWRIAESVLFGVNAGLGYMLMLAVMSFNGGVFLSIVAGLALGYLAFRSGGGALEVAVESSTCACA